MYICNQKDKENKNYMKKLIIDLISIGLTALLQDEGHRQGAEPNDDLTMMCLRVN